MSYTVGEVWNIIVLIVVCFVLTFVNKTKTTHSIGSGHSYSSKKMYAL